MHFILKAAPLPIEACPDIEVGNLHCSAGIRVLARNEARERGFSHSPFLRNAIVVTAMPQV